MLTIIYVLHISLYDSNNDTQFCVILQSSEIKKIKI